MTYSEIRKNEEVLAFIKKGNANLGAMGFTDHSEAHSGLVAERADERTRKTGRGSNMNTIIEKSSEPGSIEKAGEILKKFGDPEKDIELVKIAGFMHDIGNAVNRSHHAEYGALLANDILKKTDLPLEDRVQIVSAIGLHDESTGGATDPISAALIIADKTDVRRSRVREKNKATFDKHDRVNYAVTDTKLKINVEKRVISLNLQIDPKICSMYEYFEIFLGRMMMCKRAAEVLEASFKLTVNGAKVL